MRPFTVRWTFLVLVCAGIEAAGDPPDLARVNDFLYQLQKLDIDAVCASRFDLLVADRSRDGGDEEAWTPEEVARLREKASGGRRIVLAYLSIGEAEDYRGYWKKEWSTAKPAWLGPENPDWKGNYKVKYWDAGWQALILGTPESSLDRILAQGFDGVYLDIVDAFEFWQEHGAPDAAAKMVEFVRRISHYAKAKHRGFLVFPQNGEALEEQPGYLEAVDGIGKEDLYFAGNSRQIEAETAEAEKHLDAFAKAGKKVLVIEYCRRAEQVKEVYDRARRRGFVPYRTVRELDALVINKGYEPD